MDESDNESNPPEANGEAVGAGDLPQAAGNGTPPGAPPQHPVWAASAGQKATKSKMDSMYSPISMLELELRGRGDLDGASSTASVSGNEPSTRRNASRGKKRHTRPLEYDECEDDDDDDNESSASLDMAGAAFGGTTAKACVPCGSDVSDDALSVTSSTLRKRHERAFPITGVTCVGCTLPAKIQPVVDFISKNMSSMSELALYKMAALVYKTKVAEPAEEEGVQVPSWDWKEVRAHFQLHSVDSRMQRYENIRTLSAMRKTLEMQLLRRDSETGEQSLDKQNAESIMKIIAASSRELTLLADSTTTKKRG